MRDHARVTVDRWLTVSFGLVGILGLFAAWRWRPRRTRVFVTWEATRLVPQVAAAEMLEVTFRDVRVLDPHVMTVAVTNVGPRDIGTDQFDRASPLEIHHDAVLLGVVAHDGDAPLSIPALGSRDALKLGPALLRVGETWRVDAVVDGRPSVTVRGRVANVVFDERTRKDLLELVAGATAGGLTGILTSLTDPISALLMRIAVGPWRRR